MLILTIHQSKGAITISAVGIIGWNLTPCTKIPRNRYTVTNQLNIFTIIQLLLLAPMSFLLLWLNIMKILYFTNDSETEISCKHQLIYRILDFIGEWEATHPTKLCQEQDQLY